jgi:hypothetical protein
MRDLCIQQFIDFDEHIKSKHKILKGVLVSEWAHRWSLLTA